MEIEHAIADGVLLRLPDEPNSVARARGLARHLRGASRDRIEDARLLLTELVAGTLHDGVGLIELKASAHGGCLRLEVSPSTPGADFGRHLLDILSDRSGMNGTTRWCELDGTWALDR